MSQQVPTNGFIAPPAQPAASPDVPGTGFTVPPAGDPARLPGNPVVLTNQTPGWVPQGQAPAAPPPPAAPAAAATPADLSAAIAAIQAALGNPAAAAPPPPPAQVVADKPGWLTESVNTFDLSKVEDPVIRSMATVLQVAGKDLDLDRVLGKALANGDVSLIDNAYLHEAGGAQAAQLAEIAKGIVQAVSAKADAITASVYESAGGEAGWMAAVAAFNKSAPQELRVTVAQMLDSTHENFIKAGAKIVAEYGRSSGAIPQLGAPLLGSSAASAVQGQGLSKLEFQKELNALKPDTRGYEEARAELFARRALGKQSGL